LLTAVSEYFLYLATAIWWSLSCVAHFSIQFTVLQCGCRQCFCRRSCLHQTLSKNRTISKLYICNRL